MAKTTSERRDIEAKLLDIAKQREKNDLTTQLKTLKPGSPEAEDVQAKLDNVDADYALKGQANDQANASPIDKFADDLPHTAAMVKEAFQQAAVDGVGKVNDALDTSIDKMLKLHGLAGSILEDFIKIALQSAEGSLFKDLGFGSSASGSTGGAGGIISKIIGSASGGGRKGIGGFLGKILGIAGSVGGGGAGGGASFTSAGDLISAGAPASLAVTQPGEPFENTCPSNAAAIAVSASNTSSSPCLPITLAMLLVNDTSPGSHACDRVCRDTFNPAAITIRLTSMASSSPATKAAWKSSRRLIARRARLAATNIAASSAGPS